MDKKLTDNEIVKALECCNIFMVKHCVDCPLFEKDFISCEKRLGKLAIDLINRLQAENERLQKEKDEYAYLYDKHINTAFSHIKAEAYKEFADRLKERISNKFWDGNKMHELKVPFVGVDDIDNLLKELVGDNNV